MTITMMKAVTKVQMKVLVETKVATKFLKKAVVATKAAMKVLKKVLVPMKAVNTTEVKVEGRVKDVPKGLNMNKLTLLIH